MWGKNPFNRESGDDGWYVLPLGCFTLFGFAVAQPLFDLFNRNPVFLLEHAAGPRELVLLIGLSWLVPGIVAALLVVAARVIHRSLAFALYLLLALVMTGATILPMLHSFGGDSGWIAVVAAVAIGCAATVGLKHSKHARWGLALGALAPLIFTLGFIIHPSTQSILSPGESDGSSRPIMNEPLRSLILVIFDELPTTNLLSELNRIDAGRYPNFAALRDDSIWFRNCYTVSSLTHSSVPAILTARYVRDDRAPVLRNYPDNLVTLLQKDALVVAEETLTHLSPPELTRPDPTSRAHRLDLLLSDAGILYLHRLLPGRLANALPEIDAQWAGFGRAGALLAGHPGKFMTWVDRLQRGFKPTAGVIHVVFPHQPYVFYGDGTQYSDRGTEPFCPRDRWVDDPWPVEQSWSRSLQQLEVADALLGYLMDRLHELGLYDETVIAVTADHGASYRPGDFHRRLSATNSMDILPVPFLLKLPDGERAGELDERLVATVDVIPTLAEAAGFTLPWTSDGVSYLDTTGPPRSEIRFFDPHDQGRERILDPAVLDSQRETLVRRLEVPRMLQARPELIGQPLKALSVGEASELRARWDSSAKARRGFLPGEVRGFVEVSEAMTSTSLLALARNDTVIAVTKTVKQEDAARAQEWIAWLPRQHARARLGALSAYELDGDTLRPMVRFLENASILGRRLGASNVEGVVTSGVYPEQSSFDGVLRRWLAPVANISAPLQEGESCRFVDVDVERSSPQGSHVVLRVGGETLFEGDIPAGNFKRRFELERPVSGASLQIEVQSTEFIPTELDSSSRDQRSLGLLLNGIWLR